MRPWILRIAVFLSLGLVSWFFGPQAYGVLSARIGRPGPLVDLDRVASTAAPAWLQRNPVLIRSVLTELSPVLSRQVRQDDTAGLAEVIADLQQLSWVASAALRPAHPDRLQLALELRRPVLELVPEGPAAESVPIVLVSAEGICLHREPGPESSGLPRCRSLDGYLPGSLPLFELGKEHPDPRVLAAARTAVEWRDEFLPRLSQAPALVEVDASNLNYRLLGDQRYSEVRVVLQRADGGTATFGYGRVPGHPLPRLPVSDKVQVLKLILARFPGLNGVDKGDLRFINLWENWLRPRPPASGTVSIAPK